MKNIIVRNIPFAWFDEKALEIKYCDEVDIRKLQNNLKTYAYAINVTGTLDQHTYCSTSLPNVF
jgi:N-acetyl-anhydromuramyl-L-alanine amidase AmpD